jgi:peptidoglycan/LPS O-acetylase OafA/YrhL
LPERPLKAEKLLYLEAIRGLAALIVVFSHFIYAFYPDIKGALYSDADTASFAGLIAMTPLNIWHEGQFAVRIFFVLSGLVLSLSFFKTGDREKIVSGASRRYFRLFVPIFMISLFAYLIHVNNLFFNNQAAALISNSWLAPFYQFDPDILLFLREGLYGAILNFDPTRTYDSVLWTMEIEFFGSLFVFGFLFLFGNSNMRHIAYVAVFVILSLTGRPYAMDFLFGIILCDLFVNKSHLFEFPLSLSLLFVGLGLFLGGLRHEWIALPGAYFWDSIGAVLVIAGVAANARLRSFLQTRIFAFLGRVSFGLYLVHWLVLMSLGCGLYVFFRNSGIGHDVSALSAGFLYVAVSLFMAWIFYHCADRPAIWLGHLFYNRLRHFGQSGDRSSGSGIMRHRVGLTHSPGK